MFDNLTIFYMKSIEISSRKQFLKSAMTLGAGVATLGAIPGSALAADSPADDRHNVIGPRTGYTPHVGTVLSMMSWMRKVVVGSVNGMSQEQLDYLHDNNSNSIGSMLFHLAATERFYQIHTFEGKQWGDWSEVDKNRFEVAMELGDEARAKIKGNNLSFYLDALSEVRNRTLAEFKKRDDAWLLSVDEKWFWGPTNNYCKWFHVCEHESNHNGQIKWIRGRLPKK